MKTYTLKFDKNKKRDYAVDIKEFFEKWQPQEAHPEYEDRVCAKGYKMFIGTPILVNIDGTYIKSDDLPKICKSSSFLLFNYMTLLKQPKEGFETWRLIWS